MTRALGYKREQPDERDEPLRKLGLRAAVPQAFSLKSHVVSVLDQGPLSSCVANATAQAIRLCDRLAGAVDAYLPARLFLYYWARAYQGDQERDEGTYIRDCMKACRKFGFPREMYWAYTESKVNDEPGFTAVQRAFDNTRLGAYHRITGHGDERLLEIKAAIAAGRPVVFGTDVSKSFVEGVVGETVRPPRPANVVGAHAMLVISYSGDRFGVLNSWSSSWGKDGMCWFSPEYVTDERTSDLWAVQR